MFNFQIILNLEYLVSRVYANIVNTKWFPQCLSPLVLRISKENNNWHTISMQVKREVLLDHLIHHKIVHLWNSGLFFFYAVLLNSEAGGRRFTEKKYGFICFIH